MKFRYTLELLTVIAILAFCVIFLYTSSTMSGAEFAGSDNVGSGLIAELSGTPQENFTPSYPSGNRQAGKLSPACLHSRLQSGESLSGEYSGSG